MNEQELKDDAKKVLAWTHEHTVATAAILGALAGWLLPKIVGWFL